MTPAPTAADASPAAPPNATARPAGDSQPAHTRQPPKARPVPKAAVMQPSSAPVPVAAPPSETPTQLPAPQLPPVDSAPSPPAIVAPVDSSGKKAEKQDEKAQLKDGVFYGWGTSRHGDIQASIEIRDGRIVGAYISQCRTQYSCSWVSALPPEVVARQSPDVDYVSGATQSSNAFYYAVVEALSKAK